MQRDLLVAVGRAPHVRVSGRFYRHSHPDRSPLQGSASGGRWGPEGAYSVLYLGRPPDTVIVEAYRHLVDDDDNLTGRDGRASAFSRRSISTSARCLICARRPHSISSGSTPPPCGQTSTSTRRAGESVRLHTSSACTASSPQPRPGWATTLALFDEQLPASELPRLATSEIWAHLPPDPRRLRLADAGSAAS